MPYNCHFTAAKCDWRGRGAYEEGSLIKLRHQPHKLPLSSLYTDFTARIEAANLKKKEVHALDKLLFKK